MSVTVLDMQHLRLAGFSAADCPSLDGCQMARTKEVRQKPSTGLVVMSMQQYLPQGQNRFSVVIGIVNAQLHGVARRTHFVNYAQGVGLAEAFHSRMKTEIAANSDK